MQRTIRNVTVLALMGCAALAGYLYGSQPKHCQQVILLDIAEHQQFTAALTQQVNPDFLTAMMRGK